MSSDFFLTAPPRQLRDAAGVFDDLMARVGVDGLVAAFATPALLARVDQHAAAVREALRRAGRRMEPEALAAYAVSIVAAAHRSGRPVPEPGLAPGSGDEWLCADWHLHRLLGVCAIAEAAGWL